MDQSPEMLARSVARSRAEEPDARHVRGELRSLPFPAKTFDLAICALALCHVPDLGGTVSELARVLRPCGHLIVTDFHPDAVEWGMRSEFRQGEVHYRLPNPGHSREDYLQALAASGLRLQAMIEATCGEVGVPHPRDMDRKNVEEYDQLGFLLATLAVKPNA